MNDLARYRLPALEDIGWHCGCRNRSISVVNLVDVGDIRDVRNIRHVSDVRDIDLAEVIGAVVIPRKVRFTRSQWKPSRQANRSDPETNGEAGTPNECDQGWRIYGQCDIGTREPAPSHSNAHPAAIVERAEAPWFIFHPSPAPRLNPDPVTETIGNPSNRCDRRKPNWTIVIDVLPVAVLVQVVIAWNPAADVLRGG